MFSDISRRPAIFAAEREALEKAQDNKQNWRGDADRRVARQHPDEEGRGAHQAHGDEERVLASDKVADAPKEDRPERSHRKARSKGGERKDEAGGFVDAGEKLREMTVASRP